MKAQAWKHESQPAYHKFALKNLSFPWKCRSKPMFSTWILDFPYFKKQVLPQRSSFFLFFFKPAFHTLHTHTWQNLLFHHFCCKKSTSKHPLTFIESLLVSLFSWCKYLKCYLMMMVKHFYWSYWVMLRKFVIIWVNFA